MPMYTYREAKISIITTFVIPIRYEELPSASWET